MVTIEFNPFEDRFSRDLRNDLSEALVKTIESGNSQFLEDQIATFRQHSMAQAYADYLEFRTSRYQKALAQIGKEVTDPIARAVILWDLQLFFEVHEILEHAWYEAEGDYKSILQALIRAAGVYIKLEFRYVEAAQKIASKALPVLEEHRSSLEKFFVVDRLLSSLKNLGQVPPELAP